MLTRLRRLDEARAVISSALQLYPGQRIFLDDMGALLFAQGDMAGAEREFRASIAAKPTSVFGYANLAGVLLHENRDDEALATLQDGLRVRPHSTLYGNLGTILYAKGRYIEAAQAFERAVSADKGRPNDSLDWANLADALRWIPGRHDDAQAAYRRALQLLAPDDAGGQDARTYSRAALYAARLHDPRSAGWLRLALAHAPDAADVQFRAALTSELLDDHDQALEHLRAAARLGYPTHLIDTEPDLAALRRDRRYQEMMAKGAL
jgi:serine/threonine-protein kinase